MSTNYSLPPFLNPWSKQAFCDIKAANETSLREGLLHQLCPGSGRTTDSMALVQMPTTIKSKTTI